MARESHTVSADGLTWEFKLRTGVKFHDGSEITADDVVYSFKRMLAIGKAPAGAVKPVLKPDSDRAGQVHGALRARQALRAVPVGHPLATVVNRAWSRLTCKDNDWGEPGSPRTAPARAPTCSTPPPTMSARGADLKRNPDHFMGWGDNPKAPT